MKTQREILIMRNKIEKRLNEKEESIDNSYIINQLDERVKSLNWILGLGFLR